VRGGGRRIRILGPTPPPRPHPNHVGPRHRAPNHADATSDTDAAPIADAKSDTKTYAYTDANS
jgi:hypothetical protein